MPWNSSNPLYRWKMKQKGLSVKTAHKRHSRLSKMPKRSYRRRRATRRFRPRGFFSRIRRHKDRRFPLSAGIGLGVSLFAPPAPGWETPISAIQRGAPEFALQSFVRSWTGLAIGGIGGQAQTYFNPMEALNPFNMNEAPAWKSMFWSAIAMKLVKKFIHTDPISKIPIVGKYAKFS